MILTTALLLTAMTSQTIPQHVATKPDHRLGDQWWKDRHEHCVELTKNGNIDVVFLGDSITQGWEGTGKAAWDKHFANLKPGNFGFSGDRTEHVLWRLENGEIMGLDPKLVVILIGTNNVGHGSSNAAQTIDGTHAVLNKLRTGLPKANILLLGVFPRGEQPTDPLRIACADISKGYKDLAAKDEKIHFLDIGDKFINPDGKLKMDIMPDALHLNEQGYEIWATSIAPTVKQLVSE